MTTRINLLNGEGSEKNATNPNPFQKSLKVSRSPSTDEVATLQMKMKALFSDFPFGQIARFRAKDRSKLCQRCGMEGHIAKECAKEASCMFCKKDDANYAKHVENGEEGKRRCETT